MSRLSTLCPAAPSVRTVQADASYAECEISYVFSSATPIALMLHLCIKHKDGSTVNTADAALHVKDSTATALRVCLQKPTLDDAVYTLCTTLEANGETCELSPTVFSITPCRMPIPDDAR